MSAFEKVEEGEYPDMSTEFSLDELAEQIAREYMAEQGMNEFLLKTLTTVARRGIDAGRPF